MSASCPNRSLLRLVNWRLVLLAGLPLWAVVAGVVAWQKSAPRSVAAVPPPSPVLFPPPPEMLPPPRVATPEPEYADGLTDAERREAIREYLDRRKPAKAAEPVKPVEIDPDVAEAVGGAVRQLWHDLFAARPDAAKANPDPNPAKKKPVPDGCKTYDTAVHFVKGYDEAKRRAGKQEKLVFVLHLSGNLDDDGFT